MFWGKWGGEPYFGPPSPVGRGLHPLGSHEPLLNKVAADEELNKNGFLNNMKNAEKSNVDRILTRSPMLWTVPWDNEKKVFSKSR